MGFSEDIQKSLLQWGASFVGCSYVKDKLPQNLQMLKYAITVGVQLSDFIIDEITDSPTYTYFHHYRSVNSLIDQITLRGMLSLQQEGYKALAVPASQTVNDSDDNYSAIFPHKTAAVYAGLGWIGKNALFISERFGPRVRLGTILTNLELPAENIPVDEKCGNCRICVDKCPAVALSGSSWQEGCERSHLVDAKACSDFMNRNFKHIGRGSVCGICIKVCPHGRNGK